MMQTGLISQALHVRLKLAEKRGEYADAPKDSLRTFSIVWRQKAADFAKSLLKLNVRLVNPYRFKKFLFVFVTHNQHLALSSVWEKYTKESTCVKHDSNVGHDAGESASIPYLYIQLYDFLAFPFFYFRYKKGLFSKYSARIKDVTILSQSSFTVSTYRVFNFLFWIKKPKYLVMANDHSDVNVAVLHAAQRRGVKSIYFQHANVSDIFPPMTFDFAFLYSKLAADVYGKIAASHTMMICAGNMKADQFIHINSERSFDPENLRIVLCVNTVAEIPAYENLAVQLAEMDKVKSIKFRLHPYLMKTKLSLEHPKIIFSDSKVENSFECFKDIDLHIAGNSSIIEEALFTDTPTIYFDLEEKMSDYYGYVKYGVVIASAKEAAGVLGFLLNYTEPISVVGKASLYSSSINTRYSGRTIDLIEQTISDIDKGEFPNSEVLEPVSEPRLPHLYQINQPFPAI